MTRFIIFVTLLGVQFACGVSETVLSVYQGSTISLEVPRVEDVSECKVRTSTGEEYEYKAGSQTEVTDRIRAGYSMLFNMCNVRVMSAIEKDTGIWKITTFSKGGQNPQEYRFRVYIEENVQISPASTMLIETGHYAYVRLVPDFEHLTKCTVTTPQDKSVDMLKTKGSSLERYGPCGFRLLAELKDSGRWKIHAVVNETLIYKSVIYVNVFADEELPKEMPVLKYQRLNPATIRIGPQTASFCQLTNPRGKTLPLIRGPCEYDLPMITRYHDGVWVARVGTTGVVNITTFPFKVITHETRTFNTYVNTTENGKARLLCQAHIDNPSRFGFCRFTRPDGQVLNLSPGIGIEGYSAFKVSEIGGSVTDLSCGLLIHDVSNSDYGTWKCEVSIGHNDQYFGSLLRLVHPNATIAKYNAEKLSTEIEATDVFVKDGDEYTVKCIANAALNYCWFRSPNGTAYSVSYGGHQSTNSLPYDGAGLMLGECGARIDKAVYTDQGDWRCNLGVVNSTEESVIVSVFVTESYVIARESGITLNKNGYTTLSCNLLPRMENEVIYYCRWVRPDGYGIRNTPSSRYTTSTTESECKLVILNGNEQEDIGRWTCVAGLAGIRNEEAWAQITIYSGSSSYSMLVGLTVALCALLAIGSFGFAAVRVYRRRLALPKNPPAYSPEDQLPIPGYLKPNDVSKEFQY